MSEEREPPPLKIYDQLVAEYQGRHAKPDLFLGRFHGTQGDGLDPAGIMLSVALAVLLVALTVFTVLNWPG